MPDCPVCGMDVTWDHEQDVGKASWGPITVYYHHACEPTYRDHLAPRLRDALLLALRKWQRIAIQGPQRSTTDREPTPDQ
jgi:hypothetical protein